MGFFGKNKVKDAESARNIPQEQQKIRESTLVTVPVEEDMPIIENDSDLNKLDKQNTSNSQEEFEEFNKEYLPKANNKEYVPMSEDALENEMATIQKRLDEIQIEKARQQEEKRQRELAAQQQQEPQQLENQEYQQYQQPSVVYLNESECLREILRKLDYLIVEISRIKKG